MVRGSYFAINNCKLGIRGTKFSKNSGTSIIRRLSLVGPMRSGIGPTEYGLENIDMSGHCFLLMFIRGLKDPTQCPCQSESPN